MTGRLTELGKEWQSRLKRFFDTPLDADATPLEISLAVLEEIERRVQPAGRGRRVFPYNRLVVRVLQTVADRPALEAVYAGLDRRVRERLQELRCETPDTLDVKVAIVKKPPSDWPTSRLFGVEYHADAEAVVARPEPRMLSVQISVLKGSATQNSYSFSEPAIPIGRSEEATDEYGRVRRNRVAFLDIVDGVNETVGRAHARLQFSAAAGEFRVFDEGSSNGTSIIRNGTTIHVPARDPRGVRVRSGDEIQVGRAILGLVIGG